MVTGEHASIHGRGQLQLGIESLVLPNCRKGIPLKSKASKKPNWYKAMLAEGVCQTPLAKTVAPVRVDGAQADYHWELLEQPTSLFASLLVARTLIGDLQRKEVALRVMNLSNQRQVIRKGTKLACCKIHSVLALRVDTEREILTGHIQNAKILVQLPPHLKELCERSVATLDET